MNLDPKLVSKLIESTIVEELNPSQKRAVSGWFRGDYSFSNHVFGGHDTDGDRRSDRITIPLRDPNGDTAAPDDRVKRHLAEHGWDIHNYKAGHAIKADGSDKRVKRIGALLNSGDTAHPEIAKIFESDPARRLASKSYDDMQVVISRHREDVAGMSTNRGWKSCQALSKSGKAEGLASALHSDFRDGTHVAYLCKAGDHDIERPMARIALRPYVALNGHKIIRPSNRQYGAENDAFAHTVRHFTEEHFPAKSMMYAKRGGYSDSGDNQPYYGEITHEAAIKSHKNGEASIYDLIENPRLPAKTLMHFAKRAADSENTNERALKTIAGHDNATPAIHSVIMKAAEHVEPRHANEIYTSIAQHPNISNAHANHIANNSGTLAMNLLRNDSLPDSIKKKAIDGALTKAKEIYQHNPGDSWRSLNDSLSYTMFNSNSSPKIVEHFFNKAQELTNGEFAKTTTRGHVFVNDSRTSGKIIDALHQHGRVGDDAIGYNKNTLPETLERSYFKHSERYESAEALHRRIEDPETYKKPELASQSEDDIKILKDVTRKHADSEKNSALYKMQDLMTHPNATKKMLDHAITHKEGALRMSAYLHNKATTKQRAALMMDPKNLNYMHILTSIDNKRYVKPSISAEQAKKVLSNVGHPEHTEYNNAPPGGFYQDRIKGFVAEAAIRAQNPEDGHDHWVNHEDPRVVEAAFEVPERLTRAHIRTGLKSKNDSVRFQSKMHKQAVYARTEK